jgi:hypothetical protein
MQLGEECPRFELREPSAATSSGSVAMTVSFGTLDKEI